MCPGSSARSNRMLRTRERSKSENNGSLNNINGPKRCRLTVIPAKAGIHRRSRSIPRDYTMPAWVSACMGTAAGPAGTFGAWHEIGLYTIQIGRRKWAPFIVSQRYPGVRLTRRPGTIGCSCPQDGVPLQSDLPSGGICPRRRRPARWPATCERRRPQRGSTPAG
jgi:hypothetical protein